MTESPQEISLRRAAEQDAPIILDLMQRAFQEYIGFLDPPSGVHKETVESVLERMKQGEWVLAELDGTPVGCVMFERRDSFVYLGRLSVPPEFRGRGIGDALMDFVEEQARQQGVKSVRLGTRLVLERIRAKYERRGYQILCYEAHPGYSKPTFVTMEKVIQMRNPDN